MKKLVAFSIILFTIFFYIFVQGTNEQKQYIEKRIEAVNGTVTDIKLSQSSDLMTYKITYLDSNKTVKHAIYMTKLGLDEFNFIEN